MPLGSFIWDISPLTHFGFGDSEDQPFSLGGFHYRWTKVHLQDMPSVGSIYVGPSGRTSSGLSMFIGDGFSPPSSTRNMKLFIFTFPESHERCYLSLMHPHVIYTWSPCVLSAPAFMDWDTHRRTQVWF